MLRVFIRFYAELNDFLPPRRRQVILEHVLHEHASVKHVCESLGVPHTEVNLILINGTSVDFSCRVSESDRISVYPAFKSIDIDALMRVRPRPSREPRFVLDAHLGKLAGYLRMLGFDALYRNDYGDEELATVSRDEGRILLSRDRRLLTRSAVTYGHLLRESDPRAQLTEVVKRYDLSPRFAPFTRCMRCNGALEAVAKEAVWERLLPRTRLYYDEFAACRDCGRIFWKGSHYDDMRRWLGTVASMPHSITAASHSGEP